MCPLLKEQNEHWAENVFICGGSQNRVLSCLVRILRLLRLISFNFQLV
jgi:hypothetical protein